MPLKYPLVHIVDVRPGFTHAKHLHRNCDEVAVYLKGHGTVAETGYVYTGDVTPADLGSSIAC